MKNIKKLIQITGVSAIITLSAALGTIVVSAIIVLSVALGSNANAARLNHESVYQKIWCDAIGGVTEYRLDDGTRVDCFTDYYAVEFDFADKWYQAVGQSLYYAEKTDRQAVVALILEKPSDLKYWDRLEYLVNNACLDIKMVCIGSNTICDGKNK